jgi:hypothetical protein
MVAQAPAARRVVDATAAAADPMGDATTVPARPEQVAPIGAAVGLVDATSDSRRIAHR